MLEKQLPPITIMQEDISEFDAGDIFHSYRYNITKLEIKEKVAAEGSLIYNCE